MTSFQFSLIFLCKIRADRHCRRCRLLATSISIIYWRTDIQTQSFTAIHKLSLPPPLTKLDWNNLYPALYTLIRINIFLPFDRKSYEYAALQIFMGLWIITRLSNTPDCTNGLVSHHNTNKRDILKTLSQKLRGNPGSSNGRALNLQLKCYLIKSFFFYAALALRVTSGQPYCFTPTVASLLWALHFALILGRFTSSGLCFLL